MASKKNHIDNINVQHTQNVQFLSHFDHMTRNNSLWNNSTLKLIKKENDKSDVTNSVFTTNSYNDEEITTVTEPSKIFSLFPTHDQNNETINSTKNSNGIFHHVYSYNEEFNNLTNEFDSFIVNSELPNTLKAPKKFDEPKLLNNSEPKTIRSNSSNTNNKLENVSPFLINISTMLELITKNFNNFQKDGKVNHNEASIEHIPRNHSESLNLVAKDIVQEEIGNVLKAKNDNISIRELPQGVVNHLSKNIPLDNHKLHVFTNGWRAIQNLKYKPKTPQQLSFEHNLIEKKTELTNLTNMTDTITRTETDTLGFTEKQNSIKTTIIEANQTSINDNGINNGLLAIKSNKSNLFIFFVCSKMYKRWKKL